MCLQLSNHSYITISLLSPFPAYSIPFLSQCFQVQHLHLATEIILFIDSLTLGFCTRGPLVAATGYFPEPGGLERRHFRSVM